VGLEKVNLILKFLNCVGDGSMALANCVTDELLSQRFRNSNAEEEKLSSHISYQIN
jgi:hypothetical protein